MLNAAPADFGARRVKRGQLSSAKILLTALAIVDAHGVDAVTIRAITRELGLSTMSVYRHFDTKDAILDGLGAFAWEVLDTTSATDTSWRDQVADVFRRMHHKLREHPGLVEIMLTRPFTGLSVFRTVERVLGTLRTAGFSNQQAFAAIIALESFTLGFSVQQRVRDIRRDADDHAQLANLPAEDFPNLCAVRQDVPSWTTDANFEVGLRNVIRGLSEDLTGSLTDPKEGPHQ